MSTCFPTTAGSWVPSRSSVPVLGQDGIAQLLEEVYQRNPDFAYVRQVSELVPSDFEPREYQRPAGYSAYTTVHVGRLACPTLNDTGATCSCMGEEQAVMIINHINRHLFDYFHHFL